MKYSFKGVAQKIGVTHPIGVTTISRILIFRLGNFFTWVRNYNSPAMVKLTHPYPMFTVGVAPNFTPIIYNRYITGLYNRLNKKIDNLRIKDSKASPNF